MVSKVGLFSIIELDKDSISPYDSDYSLVLHTILFLADKSSWGMVTYTVSPTLYCFFTSSEKADTILPEYLTLYSPVSRLTILLISAETVLS